MTPAVAAICRIRGLISSHFNFHLLPTTVFRHRFMLSGDDRNGTTKTRRQGVSTASWNRTLISSTSSASGARHGRKSPISLFTEKGIRVTLYAPYRFYRRKLKRAAKPNWENVGNDSRLPPARPDVAASRPQSRPSPLPPKPVFNQPNISTKHTENFT
jgi:hypothetical protein